jgi:hypothetical protein
MLIKDRTRESSSTSGTGALTLGGAEPNRISFGTAYASTTTPNIPYAIVDSTNNMWEIGFGTYTTGTNTLSRDFIVASSNNTNPPTAVSLLGAVADVFGTWHQTFANWGMTKESLDAGEVVVIPANYQSVYSGVFTDNGGILYMFGDWIHT